MSLTASRYLILVLILYPVASVTGFAQSRSPEAGQITLRFKQRDTVQSDLVMPAQPDVEAPVQQAACPETTQSEAAATKTVEQVQFEYTPDLKTLTMPQQYRLAQNPLEDLQSELDSSDETDDMGGMFDELNDVSSQVEQREGSAIGDILGRSQTPTTNSAPQIQRRSPLSALDKNAKGATRKTVVPPPATVNPNTGLRDDSYYQSLGAPKTPRKPQTDRSSLPMTMGNIFGDEDEYDPECVKRYCQSVWQCAGGRGLNWSGRIQRDLNRSRMLQNSQRSGTPLGRNNCKCKKVNANANAGNSCQSCQQGAPFDGYYDGQYDGPIYDESGRTIDPNLAEGGMFGGEVYEDLSEIGQIQQLPTPANPPLP